MDLLDEGGLQSLIAESHGPCVSIFFSPDRAGRSALRFGELLHRAEERLRASGVSQAAEILEPARQVARKAEFWKHAQEGLAVFCSPAVFRFAHFPLPFDSRVLLGHRFLLAPIAPFFLADDISFARLPAFEEGRFGQVNGSLRDDESASAAERQKEAQVVLH